ncbi:MAG TPA: Uma2 family endonuclease [Pirellulales bacterium]|nr:Uma2 family endonuclease [Pirellulales bacterium]
MSTVARFTLEEFDRMVDAAVFNPDRRIELIFGALHEMSPVGPRHRRIVVLLTEWANDLTAGLRDRLAVQVQSPLRLQAQSSGPIPDMSWIDRQCLDATVLAQDKVLLVIEVADSTLPLDRGRKSKLYAKAGVPDYWIVNLVDNCVEVRRDPKGTRYQTITTHSAGEEIRPLLFPECPLRIGLLFG